MNTICSPKYPTANSQSAEKRVSVPGQGHTVHVGQRKAGEQTGKLVWGVLRMPKSQGQGQVHGLKFL